jgi:hypothetical protein
MRLIEDFAHKQPAFVAQLAAVIRGKKPAVRVEFELHSEDYANFIELLTDLNLVWFEHSPNPIRICYPTSLQKSVEAKVKALPWYVETKNYRFQCLSASLSEYEKFWASLTEGKLIPLNLAGGTLNPSSEIIITKDFEGLTNFLTQYAIAKTQRSQTQQSMELFDRILGTAFGYPECCTERFTREREKRKSQEDYLFYESIIEKGLEKSVPIELKVVAHVPCSVLCQPSVSLGREYLAALKEYDPEVYETAVKEMVKPTLFIDLWHQFTVDELKPETVGSSVKIKKNEFRDIAKKESIEPKEVMLGRIRNVPFQYLADFVGLWWIGVDLGNAVVLCNAETGEIRLYRRHSESNIADYRIYGCNNP